MTKEDLQNRIEQIAYNGATDGYNQTVIESEAEKLAEEIIKLFTVTEVFETLKRVEAYLVANEDVLAPFPTRSELDNLRAVMCKMELIQTGL